MQKLCVKKRKQSKMLNSATGFFHRDVSHESNVKERKTLSVKEVKQKEKLTDMTLDFDLVGHGA